MNFRVGQKVVCIAKCESGGYGSEIQPAVGQVCTVRNFDYERSSCKLRVGIRLVEIVNKPMDYSDGYGETSFPVEKFRPVAERGTDTGMAILRKVADDASKQRVLTVF